MKDAIGYFDGSCYPFNPGGTARAGWIIQGTPRNRLLGYGTRVIGSGKAMTNNVAEYHGLLDLLTFVASREDLFGIKVFGDSKLVVNMATGEWGRKNPHKESPHLVPLLARARELIRLTGVEVFWIPRERNELADAMTRPEADRLVSSLARV